ncbi:protein abrupt isoform X5 [Drosophila subobscura]|uniref:protein abrupt isoform X5 n=1 Tax=Drosophila subobscura TaxID=7241 RepID=UPI00155AB156|nr:protein abrupt isoform X5 [Drosophila subobscura]
MTESTQLQTAENNNAGVVKMEPPPPATSSTSGHALSALSMAATGSALSPATPPPSALGLSQHQHQHQSHQSHQSHHQQQQHYALKWNDFQTSILSSFRHLRDEEDFVDVTLACDERSFTAHKVVLSACSPYFRKLLKANPCEHPIVILRDVRSDDVENLLSFMYNGEVNVSHEQLPDFLKTAHLLQIRGLADVNGGYPYAKALSAALSHSSNSSSSHNNNLSSSHNNNLSESSKINSYLPQTQTQTMLNNSNISSGSGSNSGVLNSSHGSPFSTPQAPASVPASSAAAAAAAAAASLTAAVAAAAAATASANASSSSSSRDQLQGQSTGSGSGTPAIQELKASAASPVRTPNPNPSKASSSNHWDMGELEGSRKSHLTPPPQKRIKSADLFRAQHGISPERLLLDREFPVAGQHPLTRNRAGRDTSKDRERNLELRESLLGQALENSNGQQAANQKHDLGQSAGEDSNSSDTEPSDRGDGQHDGTLDGIDNQRSHSFPNAFLGLQGIPGLLPGPSGMGSDFVSRRSLEMRVRATDPRPCPKCGKIYRSAHTLRTHLEDKHTVCPGYRCVLCGTVAKSRNSLHSHMSRQHRGISTKDLPVLPMPSPFDPDLASRLLAKAGVKISPAELRARASPTGGSGSSGGGGGGGGGGSGAGKLDLSNASGGPLDDGEDSDEDPEDLTVGNGLYGMGGSNSDLSRYHESLLSNFGHANTTISRMRNEAAAAAATAVALGQPKDLGVQIPTSNAAGQSLLDTYLQFITENTFGMGMSQEQAAAAALRAKMAQLNAMGHSLDSLPPGLLPGQFDLSKLAAGNPAFGQSGQGLSIEPILRHDQDAAQGPLALNSGGRMHGHDMDEADNDGELRREGSEPMDLGLDNNQSGSNNEVANSDVEENYSEDEGVHNT